jgi:ketosteroid isomerase-like protein
MSEVIGTLSSAELASIRDVSDRFARHLVARDFDSIAQLYTADAVLMPPHHPAVEGRGAIRNWLGNFPRVSRFTLTNHAIEGRADLAYVRGSYEMTLHPEGAPGPIEDTGKFIEIRKRQPDGSWLLAVDTFNSDKP